MAGHLPAKKIILYEDSELSKKYEGLTEEQMRNKLRSDLGLPAVRGSQASTGQIGPDGKLVS